MTIPAVFFMLFLLVLWFVIGAKGHWIVKAGIIGLTLHLCISIGLSLSAFAGWPSDENLPDKFIVHWMVVQEPEKTTRAPGFIYIWASDISEKRHTREAGWKRFFFTLSSQEKEAPRAYVLPYSKQKHEDAEGVLTKIRDGKAVVGERGAGEGGPGEGPPGDDNANGEDGGKGGGSFSKSEDITFHELPPTSLPKK